MQKPTFAVGQKVLLTWEFSRRSGYEDKTEESEFVGMASDGCYEFKCESMFGETTHVFWSDGGFWLDDMITMPMSVVTKGVN